MPDPARLPSELFVENEEQLIADLMRRYQLTREQARQLIADAGF